MTAADYPRVVGLDLSITATGICDVWGDCITVGGKAADGDKRLERIADSVDAEVRYQEFADLVVIEDVPTHAKAAGITAMVHGAVRLRLLGLEVPYVTVPPATLKKYATNKGNANKTEMALALYKRTGLELDDDNQVDAWWLRAAGMHVLGSPVVELPAAQVDALSKVDWPRLVREVEG